MENHTQNGQFELSGESASLQTRQAAAFCYLNGYLSTHFKHNSEISIASVKFINRRIKDMFNIELLESDKEGREG